jgi:hypothetical protein
MGFFGDIFDAVTGAITNELDLSNWTPDPNQISQLVSGVRSQYGTNYIVAQNAAVAEMGQALNNFNATKPHTGADYQSFENEIQGISNTFTAYAQSLNNPRAIKGAGDVARLAHQVIADRETERMAAGIPGPTGAVTTSGTWQAGHPTVSGGGINLSALMQSPLFWPVVIGGYLLWRRG